MPDFRILSKSDVMSLLDMPSVIESNKEVYRQRARNQTSTWPTVFNVFEDNAADLDIKSGWLKESHVFGHKTVSWYKNNPAKGLSSLTGLICVYDDATGVPLGVVDSAYITGMRTGAAGAIGAQLLARRGSNTLLMVGTGAQCTYQIAATLTLMPQIRRVFVSNPHHPAGADAKVRALPAELEAFGVDLSHTELLAVADERGLKGACAEADVIITATAARKPLIERGWVQPGTHLSCIGADMEGKVEIDPRIVADALLFVDDTAHCIASGEIETGIRQGVFGADHIAGEIGDLLCGTKNGRTSDEQITVFDACGMALLDIACAKKALDLAAGRNLGVTASI